MVRIGILTYFASINYGAFLQAYALQECLKSRYGEMADVEMINYESKIAHESYLRRIIDADRLFRDKLIMQYDRFLESRKKLQLSKDALVTDSIRQVESFLRGRYDIIIAGSDEIWKSNSLRGFPTAYWLNFDLKGTVYMAYAVSGRDNYQQLAGGMRKYIETSMRRFHYIGTRDEVTRKELQKIVDREVDRNCDPVFLMPDLFHIEDKEKSRMELKGKFGLTKDKPWVSLMLIHDKKLAGSLSRMLQPDNQVINLYEPNSRVEGLDLTEISPFEWNDIIGLSDLVITDFFHGTAFSVLHGTPFVSLECSEKGTGKIENLLIENLMEDKFLYQCDYGGNSEKLAMDLYIKGIKEMQRRERIYKEKAVLRENQKSCCFFEKLERTMGM